MTNLQKMKDWLQTYPPFADKPIVLEFTYATPMGLGLYSRGLEQLSCKEDILGQKKFHCRFRFLLHLQQMGLHDGSDITAFQQWVQQQSLAGLAPVFGDETREERLTSKLQQVKSRSNSGCELSAVELSAEFMKIY